MPNTVDIDIQSRLNALKEKTFFYSNNNNNNNNNNSNLLPPRPPPSSLLTPPRQDNIFFQPFSPQQQTSKQNFFGPAPRISPVPSASPLPPDDNYFLTNKIWWNCHRKNRKSN